MPPNAETIINNGSSLSLRIDITLFIDFESATDVPPNFRTFKRLSLFCWLIKLNDHLQVCDL